MKSLFNYKLPIALLAVTALATAANADNKRYRDRMFDVVKTTDVVYATKVPQLNARHNLMAIVQDIFKQNISFYANETVTKDVDLTMDIYSPKDDTENKRAAVIVAHGGSFVAGAKGDTGSGYRYRYIRFTNSWNVSPSDSVITFPLLLI